MKGAFKTNGLRIWNNELKFNICEHFEGGTVWERTEV